MQILLCSLSRQSHLLWILKLFYFFFCREWEKNYDAVPTIIDPAKSMEEFGPPPSPSSGPVESTAQSTRPFPINERKKVKLKMAILADNWHQFAKLYTVPMAQVHVVYKLHNSFSAGVLFRVSLFVAVIHLMTALRVVFLKKNFGLLLETEVINFQMLHHVTFCFQLVAEALQQDKKSRQEFESANRFKTLGRSKGKAEVY